MIKRLIFVAIATLLSLRAFGATRTWTGTTSNAWSVAANWGGTAPAANDDLVFPLGAPNLATTNDLLAGTSYHSITFSGATPSIAGNAFTLGSGGLQVNAGSASTITASLTLAATQQWQNDGVSLSIGAVNLNGSTLAMNGTTGDTFVLGVISGAGTLVKNGVNTVRFTGNNTFTGQVQIVSGRLHAFSPNALGFADDTLGNGTVVSAGGSLAVASLTYPAERIVLNGSGFGANGALILSAGNAFLAGTVVLGTTVAMNSLATITFNGVVTGSGQFGMGGPGTYALSSINTFTGGVVWGATGSLDSILRLEADNVLPSNVSLDVGPSGLFDLNGHSQTIASLSGTGNLFFGNPSLPHTLTITSPANTTFSGNITGLGNVQFTGGTLTFTGTNTFNGTMAIAGGSALLVGGTFSPTIVQSSGSLSVTSFVSTGLLTLIGGNFRAVGFATTGGLTAGPGVTYTETIGTTAMNQFGNLQVSGAVNLGSATLQLTGTGAVSNGNQLVIIDNDGSDPVVGTFAGLPQGATIVGGPGGFNYTISYTGGTGNDVVLTAVSAVSVAATTTTLASSGNPSTAGASVTFTATVNSSGTPTGTVTFKDGLTTIGSGTLSGGVATVATTSLTVGPHNITASYGGDVNNAPSTSTILVQNVTAATAVPALDGRALAALAILLVLIATINLKVRQ